DGRNQVDGVAVAMNGAHLLALTSPLAALRKSDALKPAGQLGGEIIHADADQAGALAQCPGVAGMVAQILGDFEAANQSGLQSRRICFLAVRGDLQCRLYNRVAAAEMIDE